MKDIVIAGLIWTVTLLAVAALAWWAVAMPDDDTEEDL